jgi:hypothetical protein
MGTDAEHDEETIEKDTSYSPSSGRETEEQQEEGSDDALPEGVNQKPGAGGPDDAGDVDVPDDDIDPAVIAERGKNPL